jgi:hypothetical protein
MRHLTHEELVDLAEGARPSSPEAHLEGCGACRRQLADLVEMMAAATALEVPEPSPLFWDHLSAHVRVAVATSGAPLRTSWFSLASWSRAPLPLTAAALALLVFGSVVTMRLGPSREMGGAPPAVAGSSSLDTFADDPTLSLVADLASSMDWDAASDAGLTSRPGGAEGAVSQLTGAERIELDRLLKEALKKPGA